MSLYRYHVTATKAEGPWRLRADEETYTGKPVTFSTVLGFDKDIGVLQKAHRDVLDEVSYYGPMYFDIDADEDVEGGISLAMKSTWELIEKLQDLDIEDDYIHCWLTGGRGAHILLPPQLLGIKKPEKLLPMVYEKFAKMVKVKYMDMGIYSCGKGRMWRQQNMPRSNGKFKVPVELEDIKRLAKLDSGDCAQAYEQMCSQPAHIDRSEPHASVDHLKLKTLVDGWKKDARADKRAIDRQLKELATIDFSALPEVPGCIQKLITQGDCASSNWSQAAINLGAWIRARFQEITPEVEEKLIAPFLDNVQSSSHPSRMARRRHIINIVMSPQWVFSKGSLFSTLGKKCGKCAICQEALVDDEENEEDGTPDGEVAKWPFHEQNRIKASSSGFMLYGEKSKRALTNWTYWPQQALGELDLANSSLAEERKIHSTVGRLVLPDGSELNDVNIPYSAWDGRKAMLNAFGSFPGCSVHATDLEAQRLKESIEEFSRLRGGMEGRVSTRVCGLYLSPVRSREGIYEPHYIESSGSITLHNRQSRYKYSGEEKDSPQLIPLSYPKEGDKGVDDTLVHLMSIGSPEDISRMIGFFCAAHLKGHLMLSRKEFPLLCLYGSASAGKSSQAAALLLLNGVDNLGTDGGKLSMEGSTLPPLYRYTSSSITVPRLIDEANDHMIGSVSVQRGMIAVFKLAWEGATLQRGRPAINGRPQEPEKWKISSPLVIMSEQQIGISSVVDRSIQVHIKQRDRTEEQIESFNHVDTNKHHILQIAKLLVDKAMSKDPADFTHTKLVERYGKHMNVKLMGSRPYRSHLIVLQGLDFLAEVLEEEGYFRAMGQLQSIRDALIMTFTPERKIADRMTIRRTTSQVSQVIQSVSVMAADVSDRGSIKPRLHYKRRGAYVFLNMSQCFPAYLKECTAQRIAPTFRRADQVETLLTDEEYFDRVDTDDDGEQWIVINVLVFERTTGSSLKNFRESP